VIFPKPLTLFKRLSLVFQKRYITIVSTSYDQENEKVYDLSYEGAVMPLIRRLIARVSSDQYQLVEKAAETAFLTLSDFVRRPALTMARWKVDDTTYTCSLQERHRGDELEIDIRGRLMKSKSNRYLFPRIGERIDRRFPRVADFRKE